jgi:hypothetical protein
VTLEAIVSAEIRAFVQTPKDGPTVIELHDPGPFRHETLLLRATEMRSIPGWIVDVFCLTASSYIPKQFTLSYMGVGEVTTLLTGLVRGIRFIASSARKDS